MGRGWGVIGCAFAVTAAVACSKADGADETPARKKPTSVVTSAPSTVASQGPRFDENDDGEKVSVPVGATFEIELRSPRNPGYKYAWLPAAIDPSGIEALGKEILEPGKDVDGGSYRHVYRLRATKAGTFVVSIANTSAKSQSEVPTYTLNVRVEP
jgi:hypothetical protein